MKTIYTFAAAVLAVAVVSCAKKQSDSAPGSDSGLFEDAPVVAEKKVVNGDTVIVVNLKEKPEVMRINASELFEDLRLVKLENSEEAMISDGEIWVSPSRILCYDGNVIKQFDMDGKYISKVGAKGQGPGEYTIAPYDIKICEDADRIYILQYGAESLISYNLKGEFVENIPLAYKAPKGFFEVDSENGTITVASMVFRGQETPVVWKQDLKGNVIEEFNRSDLALIPDFSSEVYESGTASGERFGYSVLNIAGGTDSLYVYRADGKLHPEFTVDYGGEVPLHVYLATPRFFIVTTFGEPQNVSESGYILPAKVPFLVDRSTLRGAPVELVLDNLGNIVMKDGWQLGIGKDYFTRSFDPGDLIDQLEKNAEDGGEDNQELIESLSPDDNNYIVIARMRR